jgi:hypothetical protein
MSKPNTFTLLSPNTNNEIGTYTNDNAQPFSYLNIQHDDTQENEQNLDLEKIQCTFPNTFATPSKQFSLASPCHSPFPPYIFGSAKDNEIK